MKELKMKNAKKTLLLLTLGLSFSAQAQVFKTTLKDSPYLNTSSPILVTNEPLLWELPARDIRVTQQVEFDNKSKVTTTNKRGKTVVTEKTKTIKVVVAEKSGPIIEGKAAYEKRLPKMKLWSAKVFQIIRDETSLAKVGSPIPEDMNYFCPNYTNLNETQRMTFWGQLVAAITYRESGWNPVTSSIEPDHKTDRVTQNLVRSEGLMQLSYQDVASYPDLKCGFDWKKDKSLGLKNPDRTILQPYRNLRCGILILNKKIVANNRISTPNTYWSVLRPAFVVKYANLKLPNGDPDPRRGNMYSKLPWLAEQTKSLSFCNLH